MKKTTFKEAQEYIDKEKGLMFENHVKVLYGNVRAKIMYVLIVNESADTLYSEEENIYGPKQIAIRSGKRRTISSIYRLINHSSRRKASLKEVYAGINKLIEEGLITTFICPDIKKRVYMSSINRGSHKVLDHYIGDPHRLDEFGFYVPSIIVEKLREKNLYNFGRYEGNMHAVQLITPTEPYKPSAKILERKASRTLLGNSMYAHAGFRRFSRRI